MAEGLDIGASLNIVTGGVEGEELQTQYQQSRKVTEIERDFSGSFFQVGASYSIDVDLAVVGVTWRPAYEVKDKWSHTSRDYSWANDTWGAGVEDFSDKGSRDISMPSTITGAVEYNFPFADRTMVTAQVRHRCWSRYRYEEKDNNAPGYGLKRDPGYRDTTGISIGAEHGLGWTTVMRLGFSYEPFYADSSVDLVSFSCGAGIEISPEIYLDLGTSLGMRTYRGDTPFGTGQRVSVTRLTLAGSLGWSF